tara:strand:- start:2958 stop:4601 length:1644 start_codon:yes stop_codon:yes gene_type:complete
MKILLVTEKYEPEAFMRDGGARIVSTLKESFGDMLSIMQFGSSLNNSKNWSFDYPTILPDRFQQRLANAEFIAEQIKKVEKEFTHIIFVHISMQFGIIDIKLKNDIIIWTFPMFLSPSYEASGEMISDQYTNFEKLALDESNHIITPSHFEKEQLINYYSIPKEKVHVVPRGIDTNLFLPKVRSPNADLKICSIGSIKTQKNTLGLVELFFKLLKKVPSAKLKIIGPIQNESYYKKVCEKIKELDIDSNSIEFTSYLPPEKLFKAVEDCHIHISRSNCETFGRSIFETLACGIPNIAKKTANAAAEFLDDKPYVKFIDDEEESINAIIEMLDNFSHLSSMALEVGKLYDDKILAKLLVSKICNKEAIAISDFDGTLFHKEDVVRTRQSIEEFRKFPLRVICSARATEDLLQQLKIHDLKVDWIIAFSGAIITDVDKNIILSVPLILNKQTLPELFISETKKIEYGNKLLQLAIPDSALTAHSKLNNYNLRFEVYENTAFIADWESSKLHAIHKLLRHINWSGQVKVFGNGRYDMEMIKYFDGITISA